MRITVSGKNIEVTNALRSTVEKKMSKLEKYFNPDVEAHATLSVEKNRQIVEVTISVGGILLRAEEAHDDMYASIDIVVDKLEGQIRKQKTKLQRRNHMESLRFQFIPDFNEEERVEESKIVRTKRFAIKPMSAEEAVLQMELLGHSFFVYENDKDGDVNVVYKRKDGNYGLIEPEF
ncbi:ribosome hibernation-promoting factor, HPF/YfiA family [Clostridium thailandense]|uniref:Ribosome hibernation promoting factor n=1 Tax=Clostridium thailandense TaxID=2794346 RepID=A0A949WU40_9CLOT|nr:ribosome-associated translation inhibitor RaiA [Clostridium thailandense]MBV7272182.1 ribosome-associated translation inhibitor RaiA [Clostridium thailandense]MCH5135965.1 ribosome-associated translation inhibitor RaiA [Clostridiaceae bacterium UIB06]